MHEGLDLIVTQLQKVLEQNKNILEILQEMEKKKPLTNKYQSKEVDRTSSEYKSKRQVYVSKLNTKQIKEPKPSSLEYYRVDFDEETGVYS